MNETPLLMGSHRALFGICSEAGPGNRIGAIILNAGFLHHVGPFRLHVSLARALASRGCATIRLDQSGKGESPSRQGVSVDDALLLDFDDASQELRNRGVESFILIGLCSGADDAFYIARHRPSIAGLVFFDGYAPRTPYYYFIRYRFKSFNPGAWLRLMHRMFRRLLSRGDTGGSSSSMDIRNWSSSEDMLAGYRQLLGERVKILATFTNGASEYYNYRGQLASAIGESATADTLRETFYDQSDHLFAIVAHRQRLIEDVIEWSAELGAATPTESSLNDRHDDRDTAGSK